MAKLFLSIESGSDFLRLFGWLELLHSLEPLRLTAAISQELVKEDAGFRVGCRKLERFCLEKGIRLKMVGDGGGVSQGDANLVLSDTGRSAGMDIGRFFAATACPTLLLPDGAAPPAELILVYDGSAASKAAIRQFAQLFPALTELPAILLHIQDTPGLPIPDEADIRMLGASLYQKFRLVSIQRRPAEFFEAWLGMMTNPWVIAAKTPAEGPAALVRPGLAANLIRIRPMAAFAA